MCGAQCRIVHHKAACLFREVVRHRTDQVVLSGIGRHILHALRGEDTLRSVFETEVLCDYCHAL